MSFDARPQPLRQRIAIIGGGISGLAAARLLARDHHVTLHEAESRLGGHARTVMAGRRGDRPVDTGFIVFNHANYPHLSAMFRDLEVPLRKSSMSFGVSIDGGRLEYGLGDLAAITGQRRNLLRPGYLGMLRDIMRFNARAEAAPLAETDTIGDLIGHLGLGDWFRRYYLLPICGAIWSSPTEDMMNFPARALVRFFRNHALLGWTGQHQWWTVAGGSVEYVRRLERELRGLGVTIRLKAPVGAVRHGAAGLSLHCPGAAAAHYDQVILACHSDDARHILDLPGTDRSRALAALGYRDNRVVLHCDPRQMPRRRACWSSWVYRADHRRPDVPVGVSYWMNRLQDIPEDDPLFITLNPADPIPEAMIHDEVVFRHPVFDHAALTAQGALDAVQGLDGIWFAGAYTGNGFHEDGFASAVRIARRMGRLPA